MTEGSHQYSKYYSRVQCPRCKSKAGERCKTREGIAFAVDSTAHPERRTAARRFMQASKSKVASAQTSN